jgi:hypothetical protein
MYCERRDDLIRFSSMKPTKQLAVLERLLDDPSPVVREAVINEIKAAGDEGLLWLEVLTKNKNLASHAKSLLSDLRTSELATRHFIEHIKAGIQDLEEACLLFERVIHPTLSEGAYDEELDHLAWSAARIEELGGRTSVFNPLWYVGSLGIGVLASRFGQAWNLGFLAETEHQVEAHLQSHLARLDPKDVRTRALIEQMRVDEAAHAANAVSLGAAELPAPVKTIMRAVASVMTSASYRL